MQELHVVADELDRGINLVGNTGGQPAHCLELLGLAEINLKPVALRHVLGDGQTGLATIVVKTMEVDLHVDDAPVLADVLTDRKSTRLNSSHANIAYAVFCLKKK